LPGRRIKRRFSRPGFAGYKELLPSVQPETYHSLRSPALNWIYDIYQKPGLAKSLQVVWAIEANMIPLSKDSLAMDRISDRRILQRSN